MEKEFTYCFDNTESIRRKIKNNKISLYTIVETIKLMDDGLVHKSKIHTAVIENEQFKESVMHMRHRAYVCQLIDMTIKLYKECHPVKFRK